MEDTGRKVPKYLLLLATFVAAVLFASSIVFFAGVNDLWSSGVQQRGDTLWLRVICTLIRDPRLVSDLIVSVEIAALFVGAASVIGFVLARHDRHRLWRLIALLCIAGVATSVYYSQSLPLLDGSFPYSCNWRDWDLP
jgi:ABC-type spermidine/putrescine transport system permease subunit I